MRAKKQATDAQRALAAQGIGKITRGGGYRTAAKVQSDRARNMRRRAEKIEQAFRRAAANTENEREQISYLGQAERAKAVRMSLYDTSKQIPGQKRSESFIKSRAQLLDEVGATMKDQPTSFAETQQRGRMAELEWGGFMKHLEITTYSEVGAGMWTSGDYKNMSKEERANITIRKFVKKLQDETYYYDDIDPDNLTSEDKARIIEAYKDIYQFYTGDEVELFAVADQHDGGSPKDIGAINAFFA